MTRQREQPDRVSRSGSALQRIRVDLDGIAMLGLYLTYARCPEYYVSRLNSGRRRDVTDFKRSPLLAMIDATGWMHGSII